MLSSKPPGRGTKGRGVTGGRNFPAKIFDTAKRKIVNSDFDQTHRIVRHRLGKEIKLGSIEIRIQEMEISGVEILGENPPFSTFRSPYLGNPST